MKQFHYYLLLYFLGAAFVSKAQAPKDSLITADFRAERIDRFVTILEQKTNLTFYYNPADF